MQSADLRFRLRISWTRLHYGRSVAIAVGSKYSSGAPAVTAGVSSGVGTITFQVDAIQLGTVALLGNQASLTTRLIPAGPHKILVTYSGDSTHAPSTSTAVALSVFSTRDTSLALMDPPEKSEIRDARPASPRRRSRSLLQQRAGHESCGCGDASHGRRADGGSGLRF
jgi:hypothetical protein